MLESGTRLRCLLLFGAPGVGKGTQGGILAKIPGLLHVAMGDLFRSIDPDSPEGRLSREYFGRGELVPNELTVQIFERGLADQTAAGTYCLESQVLVLDGFPRNPPQAEYLQSSADVLAVIHLAASDEQAMIQRIKRRALDEGRGDDADESIIRHRFHVYHAESAPVLNCFPPDLITRVDALGTPAQVLRRILDVIVPLGI